MRVGRFRIGVFKGKKATLAAIYGFPKNVLENSEKLPGLLQIHGGGHSFCQQLAQLLNGALMFLQPGNIRVFVWIACEVE